MTVNLEKEIDDIWYELKNLKQEISNLRFIVEDESDAED